MHHLLVMRSARRDGVREALTSADIGVGIHYPIPLSQQPAMKPWATPCPVSEAAASEIVSLPMDPLMPETEVEHVCSVVSQLPGHT